MKYLITMSVLLLFTLSSYGQENNKSLALNNKLEVGVFEFKTETIDYGSIEQNSDGKRTFVFKNVGQAPIIISKTKGSCGCTIATAPKHPIMPGETANISVKYATNRVGTFSKTITLSSNASEKTKTIHIKGKVVKTNNLLAKQSLVNAN